jgi:two-component system nitrate/nitrite response regulator NarL
LAGNFPQLRVTDPSMPKGTQALASSMAQVIALNENDEIIRVLAADSTRMNSQLLAAALERDKRFQVLDPVSDSRGLLAVVAKEKPAVVVVSAELEDNPRKGFEVARELHALRSETRIVMLLDTPERSQVVESFRAGARGVFSRSDALKSLAKCIHCVSQGQVWANSKELRYLLDALGEALPMRMIDAKGAILLSRREQEVVRCVAEGLSNREIAQRLGLTEHTVKNYLFRIFDKLGVSKRVEVVLYAYSLGTTHTEAPPANGEKKVPVSGAVKASGTHGPIAGFTAPTVSGAQLLPRSRY